MAEVYSLAALGPQLVNVPAGPGSRVSRLSWACGHVPHPLPLPSCGLSLCVSLTPAWKDAPHCLRGPASHLGGSHFEILTRIDHIKTLFQTRACSEVLMDVPVEAALLPSVLDAHGSGEQAGDMS